MMTCFASKCTNLKAPSISSFSGVLHLLNNGLVAMAACNRQTPHTASISLVYTPPKHRGKGYGTRVVACLSKQLLASGKRACNLYADLHNPTSTSIYQKLGYVRIGDNVSYRFN